MSLDPPVQGGVQGVSADMSTPPSGHPSTPPSGAPPWTASEAARVCGVGRTTILRALNEGRLHGAVRTGQGWSIPLEALLGAGFVPNRPAPPEHPVQGGVQEGVQRVSADVSTPPSGHPSGHVHRVAELEAEVTAQRHRAEVAEAGRRAAEVLAAERLDRVQDLRASLRMLEAGPTRGGTAAAPAKEGPEDPPPAAMTPGVAEPLVPAAPARGGRLRAWLRGE